ncbi:nitrile hydratase accessory protein [Orrella marina]|nr:nitrile hydratase accessory protein [Orrella marina]
MNTTEPVTRSAAFSSATQPNSMTVQEVQAIQDCEAAIKAHGLDMPLLKQDGPVFCEPWQAQAFAMTLALHDKGLFDWNRWAQTLGDVIAKAPEKGDPDQGNTYYWHWLAALERILSEHGYVTTQDLQSRQQAWREAAARTPHGHPIVL